VGVACREAGKALANMQAVKPNGTMYVCKYAADVPSEQVDTLAPSPMCQVVQRLSSLGVQVTLASETEVETLMTAGRQAWSQGAAGACSSGERENASVLAESTWGQPEQQNFH